jgi:hypothetical protein
MGAEEIRATLYAATGEVCTPTVGSATSAGLSKLDFARWLIAWIAVH